MMPIKENKYGWFIPGCKLNRQLNISIAFVKVSALKKTQVNEIKRKVISTL